MKVLVLAEYYPRAADPVLGVWAHNQAIATHDAGVEVRVLVLHRPLPSLAAVRARDLGALAAGLRQPRQSVLDGVPVSYVRYLSPPRPWSYGAWGAWAAPWLARALRALRPQFAFDLIHAHNAVPAGDAARRIAPSVPLVVSVHGGDLYGTAQRTLGERAVSLTLARAHLVLANSAGTAERCRRRGARITRVVHLGTDIPSAAPGPPGSDGPPTLVSVGHLIARKRHADVVATLPALRTRHPALRYVVVGDGPERERLMALASRLGVTDMLELRGQLDHDRAIAVARRGSVFVLPSVDEAFGVAYIEAMAGGVPAIGCHGEDGPREIVAAGGGMSLVTAGDVAGLTARIDALLSDPVAREAQGRAARETVLRAFTWERCGRDTISAYRDVLSAEATA